MEKSLKKDTQREAIKGGGRVLLHDETEDSPGAFTITPQWETIAVEDIMTPRVRNFILLEVIVTNPLH